MEKSYHIEFESDAQREQFELRLQQLGIPFRLRNTQSVEEPGAQYQTPDPALLTITQNDLEMLRRGEEELKAGKTVPWEKVRKDLQTRIKRLEQSVDET